MTEERDPSMIVATLVHAGTDFPPQPPSRARLDRLQALTQRDPTWRDDRDDEPGQESL